MTLVSTPYHNLACNGRIDNLVNPSCPAVSPGGWDAEAMEKAAVERGWRPHGRGHLCPACGIAQEARDVAGTEAAAEPAKRRRGKTEQMAEQAPSQDEVQSQ